MGRRSTERPALKGRATIWREPTPLWHSASARCHSGSRGRTALCLALGLLLAASAGPALAQPSAAPLAAPAPASPDQARREVEAARARARLAALQKEAAALAARERTVLGELRALELARATRQAELARAEAELALVQADLEATTRRVEDLEARLVAERPAINDRLVALYKAGDLAAPWRWADAVTLQDAARAQRLLAAVAAEDRTRLLAYQGSVQRLTNDKQRLATRLREAADWRAQAATARDAAARAAADHATLLRSISERQDLAERLAGELRQAARALDTTVSGLPAVAAPASRAVLPVRAFRGELGWPAAGPLVSRFGREPQSRFGTGIVRNGIEIGAPAQSPVTAVHAGRVAFADQFTGFGRLVIVEHGQGVFSLYGHLDTLSVARGTQLDGGAVLGTSGRTPGGREAVYFELRIDGRPVDPLQWLKPR